MTKGERHTSQGWEISDVERLIGLPRRFIQRACYAGKDGVSILAPSTNGRQRTYSVNDLAMLFVVSLMRDERYSRDHQRHTLGEVRDAIVSRGLDVEGMLRDESELLFEQVEEVVGQYLRARALLAALEPSKAHGSLQGLLDGARAVAETLGAEGDAVDPLSLPGVELTMELLASGATERQMTCKEETE